MAGRSIVDNLDREAEEVDEAHLRDRRRAAGGLTLDPFAAYEDREAERQRQFEQFLTAQRQENDRLRETLAQMVGQRRTEGEVSAEPGHIGQLVTEAVETIKGHRDADRSSFISIREEEVRRDLEQERQKVKDLEAELAQMREHLDQERVQKESNVQDKCAEMHRAVDANQDELRGHLGELTNRMVECQDESARLAALQDQRWAEKEDRRHEKLDQQNQIQAMLAKMLENQAEDRRIAELERQQAAERASKSGFDLILFIKY
jgi:hypothetical protein